MTESRTPQAETEAASSSQELPITRLTGVLFLRMVRNFATSEVRGRAIALFAGLIALLLAINGLNILNSYVGRDFMTAIEQRSMPGFVHQALRYIGVFAVLTLTAVIVRFTEERLGLLWRDWLTRRLVRGYFDGQIYYRLGSTITNPDQRIADDVRTLTVTTLSFVLMVCNATMTIVAFSGVLYSISPLLFGVAVAYALGGSILTVLLGRRLVWLNFHQADKEANLRANLIHVRENADSVMLLRREGRLEARVLRNIDALTQNVKHIIAVNRNLSFFTTGYNYMIQILPALIVAPLFIRGQAEFGVITQSAMAFSQLLGAFSLIVNQFGQISSYAAVLARVGSFAEAVDELRTAKPPAIPISVDPDRIAYDDVTLRVDGGAVLIDRLSAVIPRGTNVLVTGPNEIGKTALLRASAGVAVAGSGRIARPAADDLLVVPERPYLPPGTLREAILRTGREAVVGDDRIHAVLESLGIDELPARVGGFDAERDWDDVLLPNERQLLSVARVILAAPGFVLLDRLHKSLDVGELVRACGALEDNAVTYVMFGNGDSRATGIYDAELTVDVGGAWVWKNAPHDERNRRSE